MAFVLAVLAVLPAALSGCASALPGVPAPARPIASSPFPRQSVPAASPSAAPSHPTDGVPTPDRPVPRFPGRTTPQGLWWGVDSTTPIDAASLSNARDWYAGGHMPAVWGRYITGHYGLRPGELAFARRHGIAVYVLVPDANCSICAGGADICGNDRTAAQATADARAAISGALRAHVPSGATLFKDVEQVGSCTGELTAAYLLAWYHALDGTRYRTGIYGNAFRQNYDFPIAYCAALRKEPSFARSVPLAADEPEPAIGAPAGTIGPRNAPSFAPKKPWCAPKKVTKIWQYGESLDDANVTDVDEVDPTTPGLLLPDGSVSG